jgi:TrmH family RNA methyltransferase
MLSRNRIKYLNSLKIKKYRTETGQFLVEGDKIIRDALVSGRVSFRMVIATTEWLSHIDEMKLRGAGEVIEANQASISRVSSLETPPPVLAVAEMSMVSFDHSRFSDSLTIALDRVQDPGNLGTIIRTADWFGINKILCNTGCADCYNPKAVQASMGALFHMDLCYGDLQDMLQTFTGDAHFPVYGTFLDGIPVHQLKPARRGIILFGNESQGISTGLISQVTTRITIPSQNRNKSHVESLNVASSVAVVCSALTHTP